VQLVSHDVSVVAFLEGRCAVVHALPGIRIAKIVFCYRVRELAGWKTKTSACAHLRANGGPGAVDGGKKRAPGRDDCAVYQTDVADSEVSAAAWESVENECY
jgi:hypothetical protein